MTPIIILIVVILICYVMAKMSVNIISEPKSTYINPNRTRVNYYDYIDNVKYVCGFENIEGGQNVDRFKLGDDRMVLLIRNYEKTIYKKDIQNVEIQTQQQIIESVNFGKMILFGAFALGMKDTKSIVKNYVVVTYKDHKDTMRSILLDSKDIQGLYNKIKEFTY